MFFTKASLLVLYLRVFNPVRRTLIILHIVLWVNLIYYFPASFIEAFQCMPVQKAWLPLWPGHCINQKKGQTSSAVVNTCSDLIILVVPIANVWRLQLHKKSKVGILTIFGFGILYVNPGTVILGILASADLRLPSDSACILSIVRVVLFAQKWPLIEGVVDGTWEFYSIELLRYVSLQRITAFFLRGWASTHLARHRRSSKEQELIRSPTALPK